MLHLTKNGRWLLLSTHDYIKAAKGMVAFDTAATRFLPGAPQRLPCDKPQIASATSGAIVAVCASEAVDLTPTGNAGPDFSAKAGVRLGLADDVMATAMTPDGQHVYALSGYREDAAWQLAHWNLNTNTVEIRDLRTEFGLSGSDADASRQAWLDISVDGAWMGVATGRKAWIVARDCLCRGQRYTYNMPVRGAAFSSDGHSLITLHAQQAPQRLEIAIGAVASKDLRRIAIDWFRSITPLTFAVAPAP